MKTYPVEDQDGNKIAFEIENIYVGCRMIANLLENFDDIADIHLRKLFSASEYLIEFKYKGVDCVVWEPFGDNSRYWIGPKNTDAIKIELSTLQETFDTYTPPFLLKVVGDILTLKFLGNK